MNKQTLTLLTVVVLLLGGVYLISGGAGRARTDGSLGAVLESVDAEKIAKIVIDQSDKTIDLELHNGHWTLANRSNYPANPSKVRSLLLKLLDLSASQRIPASEQGIKKLGLSEEALALGRARVRLLDANGKELEGLFLGDTRKTKGEPGMSPMAAVAGSGQYVRKTSGGDVFLVGLPVTVSSEVSNWLDALILNVLQKDVLEVEQFSLANEEKRQLFSVANEGGAAVSLVGGVPEGKKVQDSLVSQIASGLENFSMIDVVASADASVSALIYDYLTEFSTSGGVVYEVYTAKKDGKYFAKVQARFDEELVQMIKQDAEVAQKEAEAATTAAEDKADDPNAAKTEKSEKKEPTLSSAEAVAEQNKSFAEWIYVLAEFQAEKFRHQRDDLIQEEAKEDAAEVGRQAISEVESEG
ncbi:MAG: DUF4340 domain-containing protein [Bdellovibrionales bacterium]|nr:DUF4340 domain-containing protein [Bdellovibrionales bacterium]